MPRYAAMPYRRNFLSSIFVRSARWATLLASFTIVASTAAIAAQSEDADTAGPSVEVAGLTAGDVVTGNTLELIVTPIGFELDPAGIDDGPADATSHYHVLLDGELISEFSVLDASVSLQDATADAHALLVAPANNDHSIVEAGAIAIDFEYQPDPAAAASGEAVAISLQEFLLDPSELTLEAGSYTFEAINDGSIGHALVLEGEGISVGTPDSSYDPGTSESFTVDLAPGTYEIYCPVPGHRDAGMVGTITVSG